MIESSTIHSARRRLKPITSPTRSEHAANNGSFANTVAIDPTNPGTFFVGGNTNIGNNTAGIFESTNSGTSWTDLTQDATGVEPHTQVHAMTFGANGHLVIGTNGGVWELSNAAPGSFRWLDKNGNLNTVQFNTVALDPSTANIVYGATQNNGLVKFNDSLTWTLIQRDPNGSSGVVAVDPSNPQNIYANSPPINPVASTNGGTTFTAIVNGLVPGDPTNPNPPYAPLVIDPSNSSHLLFGTNVVYSSNNKGATWTALTKVNTAGFNSSKPIVSLAIAPTSANTIYAVTSDPRIFVSGDGGVTWTEHDIPGITDSINQIFVNPQSSQTAYAVRNVYNGVGGTGHVFETLNGGTTWTDISGNLPNIPTWSVTFDNRTDRLFVGTDAGVYSSTDNGSTWSLFKTGLPNVQVTSLELNPNLNILLAGTHGRGAYEIVPIESLSVSPENINGQEGSPLDPTKPVAEFNDSTGNQSPSAYTATINWGDGTTTTVSGSAGGIRVLPDGNLGIFAPHTYAEEGKYALFVAVASTSGISGNVNSVVNIADAPLTAVASPPQVIATVGAPFSGLVGSFTDANTAAPLTDFQNVTINWGDGTSSNGQVTSAGNGQFNVSGTHTYRAVANNPLPVSIVVNDAGGSTTTISNTAAVQDAPLTPTPLPPAVRTFNAVAGTQFTTTVAAFTSADPNAVAGAYLVTINWGDNTPISTFPQNTGIVVKSGAQFNVVASHVYASAGNFNVTTTVTDVGLNGTLSSGSSTTINSTAHVSVAPITVSAANPFTGVEGQTSGGVVATFTSANPLSQPTDFNVPSISWGDGQIGPGTIASLGNGKFTISATHVYAEEGSYTFTVTIQSVGGTVPVTATNVATINDAPITVSPIAQTGIAGQLLSGAVATFVDGNTTAPLTDFTATIDWGDGSNPTPGFITQPGGPGTPFFVSGNHNYATGSTYTIAVTVNDVGGSSDTETTTATITEGAFTVIGQNLSSLVEGGAFSGSVALLNSGNPLAVSNEYIATINWGDGTFSQGLLSNQGDGVFTISSPTGHVYAEEGTYTVTTTVVSVAPPVPPATDVLSASGTSTVTVSDAPIVSSPVAPLTGLAGAAVSGVVAAFTEYANAPLSDFTATINWGDGTSSPGVVGIGPSGTFTVSGTNTFEAAGTYAPTVSVNDVGGSSQVLPGSIVIADNPISSSSSPLSAIIGRPLTAVVATFTEPNLAVPASEFLATIDWGDGTSPTLGTITGGNGSFSVIGTHTYTKAAAADVLSVTIQHLIGGATTTSTANVHVLALLSGALSPASDTGPSNHDGITRTTTPIFTGVADPGSTVNVYVAGVNTQATKVKVGSVVTSATGHWSVTVSQLPVGVFAVTASMIDPATGQTAETVPLSTGASTGALTIATTGPTVSSVNLDPTSGTLHVIFQTGPASMYLAALLNSKNYVFDTINSSGGLTALKATSITPTVLTGSKLEVNLKLNGGKPLGNGGYVVTLNSPALIDLAGNMLIEKNLVAFPQTTNSPNPDYIAEIDVSNGRATAPFQYISLAEQEAAANFGKGTRGKIVIRVPAVKQKPSVLRFL